MERFSYLYPFTTENIAGYMSDLDFKDKGIITVTGSSDHIINSIVKGARNITTFDINPLTKYYMDLKLSGIKELSYEDFLQMFLYDNKDLNINDLDIEKDSKDYWKKQLSFYDNSWTKLKQSSLFNRKYFNPNSKLWQNLYLDKESYEKVKQVIDKVNINFINSSLQNLVLKENFDYMFLSNIADYLNLIYNKNIIENYHELLLGFLNNVSQIYFAYLYDIGNEKPRSDIDNLNKVKNVFKCFDTKTFRSALEGQENKKDGVLILRRNWDVRK